MHHTLVRIGDHPQRRSGMTVLPTGPAAGLRPQRFRGWLGQPVRTRRLRRVPRRLRDLGFQLGDPRPGLFHLGPQLRDQRCLLHHQRHELVIRRHRRRGRILGHTRTLRTDQPRGTNAPGLPDHRTAPARRESKNKRSTRPDQLRCPPRPAALAGGRSEHADHRAGYEPARNTTIACRCSTFSSAAACSWACEAANWPPRWRPRFSCRPGQHHPVSTCRIQRVNGFGRVHRDTGANEKKTRCITHPVPPRP